MAWAGSVKLPALLISRRWFSSRMSSCQAECLRTATIRVQLPAAAPILHRLRVSTRPSLQNSAHSGQHGGSLPFSFWGRGRQEMHLLCKQVDVGALPTDSTSLRPLHSGGRRLPRRSPPRTQAGFIVRPAGYGSAGHFQLRETRPMHREKPHKLLQVGVTPTPATNFPGK